MKRSTRCARMLSSKLNVPRRLVSNTGCGAKILRSTWDSAAKCTTASGFTSAKMRRKPSRFAEIRLNEAIVRVIGHRCQILQIPRVR